MDVIVLLNSSAGSMGKLGLECRAVLLPHFEAAGIRSTFLEGRGEEIASLARKAIERKPDLLIAGGGDGTISTVAEALVTSGSRVPLGILPLGTLNHLAKDLGLPLDLEGSARNFVEGAPKSIDVGEVNGRIFVNNSSIGFYPKLVRKREEHRRRLGVGKGLGFLFAFAKVFRELPTVKVRVKTDDTELVRRTPFIFVGNNDYSTDVRNIGKRERLDGGQLSLFVPKDAERRTLFKLALKMVLGRLDRDADLDCLSSDEVTVETRKPSTHVSKDGEVLRLDSPFRYRIRPGALVVWLPADE
jgi:diacylglycerol kinase family enzyme